MKKAVIITSAILGILCIAIVSFIIVDVPFTSYYKGIYYTWTAKDAKAIESFENADGYKDSDEILKEFDYQDAKTLIKNQSYDEAIEILGNMAEYKDSAKLIESIKYEQAIIFFEAGELFKSASMLFALGDYKDSKAVLYNITQDMDNRIAAFDSYICIANANGTVSILGQVQSSNIKQSDLDSVKTWTDIIAVEANEDNIIGLRSDGTVAGIGTVTINTATYFINGDSLTFYTSYNRADIHDYNNYVFTNMGTEFTFTGDFLIYGIDALEGVASIDSYYSCIGGVRHDGSVFGPGYENTLIEMDIDAGNNPKSISVGYKYSLILKEDGTVISFIPEGVDVESEDFPSDAIDVSDWSDIVYIDMGNSFSVGLKSDGSVVAVGNNASGQCDVDIWDDVVTIEAGGKHTVGLKSDGTVVAAGDNSAGQCDVETWENIIAIAASDNLTVGLQADGSVIFTESIVLD